MLGTQQIAVTLLPSSDTKYTTLETLQVLSFRPRHFLSLTGQALPGLTGETGMEEPGAARV